MSDQFMAEKNLTKTQFLARLPLESLRHFYDGCAYAPRINGVQYAVSLEEPDMFGFDPEDPHLIPRDLVYHDSTDHGAQGQQYQDHTGPQLPPSKQLRIVRNEEEDRKAWETRGAESMKTAPVEENEPYDPAKGHFA